MIILPYDCETNGMVLWREPSEHPDQPRIVQLACKLVDDQTREVMDSLSAIIKPNGWKISADLTAIHGISMECAQDEGRPMLEVLPLFIEMWKKCDQRVGHNESFDARMIRIELMRHPAYSNQVWDNSPWPDYWKNGKAFCTQANSQKIVGLPATVAMHKSGRHGPKPPKLEEAYQFFMGKPLENAHDANVDVTACMDVYWGILAHRAKAA